MRTGTLLLLVLVVLIVALSMVGSLVRFVLEPDPAVRAGPMYVMLALTTGAVLLMLLVALNASFLPIMSHQRARDVQLMMWSMAVTGVVTGLLTVGRPATPLVMRVFLASFALMFIILQDSRLARARTAARAGKTTQPTQPTQPAQPMQPHPRSRQRRGGRKH